MISAFLVINVQNDFCPGGSLAVAEGDQVVQPINALMDDFQTIILTQDWHPADHASFASNHTGAAPFDTVDMDYGSQTLWPDHCVQATNGADFHADLATGRAHAIIRKGHRHHIDSYSAFFENDRKTPTGLVGLLTTLGVTQVTMAGLATDYCVAFSALDAAALGFGVTVHLKACRAIDLDGSLDQQLEAMRNAGIALIE